MTDASAYSSFQASPNVSVKVHRNTIVGLASLWRARLQDGIIQALEQQVGQEAAGEDELQERLNFLAFKYALLVDMVRSASAPVPRNRAIHRASGFLMVSPKG